MHIPRLFLAICAISFFWTIGAVLIIIFPPLVKNVLTADKRSREPVPRDLLGRRRDRIGGDQRAAQGRDLGAIFARVGDRDGRASSCCSRCSRAAGRRRRPGQLYDLAEFIAPAARDPARARRCSAIAITGGMFVVPLYAFLTTTVDKDQTARTVAANNVVNSGAMAIGSIARDRHHRAGRRRPRTCCSSSRRCAWSRPGSRRSCTAPATRAWPTALRSSA